MKACGRTDVHRCTLGAHVPVPFCSHCGAPDVIRGDGGMALVCARCIRILGAVVADPLVLSATERFDLLEEHLDVVDLLRGAWRWTGLWPDTGDPRLISGGVADGRLA